MIYSVTLTGKVKKIDGSNITNVPNIQNFPNNMNLLNQNIDQIIDPNNLINMGGIGGMGGMGGMDDIFNNMNDDDNNISCASLRDYYLKNPKYKYFVKSHENFSTNSNKKSTIDIFKSGDLCGDPLLQIHFSTLVDPEITVVSIMKSLLDYIEFEYGGVQIDKIYGSQICDLLKLYKLSAVWTNTHNGSCLVIPLPFDLLVDKHVFPLYRDPFKNVRFNYQFNEELFDNITEITLKINYYTVYDSSVKNAHIYHQIPESKRLSKLPNVFDPLNVIFNETQFTGEESIHNQALQVLVAKYKLNFNHPMRLIYFHFTDVDNNKITDVELIRNITLQFNGFDHLLMEGYELEYYRNKYNLIQGTYCIPLSNSNDIHEESEGLINFSFIDTAVLCIKFNKHINGLFYCYGLNTNKLNI
ncbi:MAG: hypothetical protein Terrestrivirus4_57 [Terrestrivirus sp.]|uniref:NCLDV major capsid protein n=1 Tax=Terrestrivirus sp. TaxID=2487775 RepID=A0A3G4ZRF8_9VIRU|nr:MAG: hypothetical protein Terrestrivirus4_57 [Terrestrivirus sp.]